MLGNQSRAIGSHFVDDATIGEDSLAAHEDAVNVRHRNSDSCVKDFLALDTELGALRANYLTSSARHAFCSDHFNAETPLADTLNHV